ncbi:lysophospholipid acyltransferase family protein [Xanthobacter sp. DSM 24535]|uniref:lysophospholipid acyltransferase family protein n=1 Tax=Roseixanthobacter psychrophilus TaxID=3119917 RepID=UPI00372AE5FA
MWRRLRTNRGFQIAAGTTFASYFALVARTTRFVVEPSDIYERIDAHLPLIMTFWHGQHFLTPFIMQPHHKAKVLISRHADAEINAIAAERLGVGTIRGSGATSPGDFHRKGGVSATYAMIETLNEGINVAMTADVPKIARRAGLGVITIARHSGRPILPIAMATANRITLKSWDKASLNLPFGKGAAVVGDPIFVDRNVDEAGLQEARARLQHSLEAITARAEALVGRPQGAPA